MKRDIDTTRPHIGRIYDYVLGGTQNFEADRQVADKLLAQVPGVQIWGKMNRWFLQMVASRWAEEGYTGVLDLGSALPTQGHFNEFMSGKRVMFSDFDALCAEYGQELLKDEPNMRYVQADIREPGPLLEAAAQLFDSDRRIGIGCFGILYFLDDKELRRLMKALHDFCAPGSALAISFFTPPVAGSAVEKMLSMYKSMVTTGLYPRTPEEMAEAIAPWRVTEQGPLENWLDLKHLLKDSNPIREQWSVQGLFAVRD